MIGELRAQGWDGIIGGGEALTVDDFGRHLAAQGVIVPAPTTEGGIAERAGMSTRAAIVVWAEAVRATPNAAPETIAATLATRTFQFRGADLRFDADGNGSRPIYKPQRWTPAGRADMP